MGKALAEEWAKVPQEKKDEMQAEYEKEMEVWRPLWAKYKETRSYKDFVEVKTDYLDVKAQKKLQKTMNKDAPKRPKSGYMIFGSEIREQVMEKVRAENLGLGEAGKIISERWQALSEAEKARYGEMSVEQKKTFDVEFAKYRQTQQFKDFMEAKAKLMGKQGLKKITRTCLDEAPKKAPSAFGLYRNEVMPGMAAENQKKPPEEKLDMAAFARKLASMWQALTDEQKKPYQEKAAVEKEKWEKEQLAFKGSEKYTSFLEKREKIKTTENRALNLREMPKRPKSVFALFAEERKGDVEPGKGEGKGRSALKTLWESTPAEEKKKYEDKEKELKDMWMKELAEYKAGEQFKTFETVAKKVKLEFQTEADKVIAMRFLKEAPPPPPKSAFALYVKERKKRPAEEMEETVENDENEPKAKASTQLSAAAAAGDKKVEVLSTEGFCIGDKIQIGEEKHVVEALGPIALRKPLAGDHAADTVVVVIRAAAEKKAKNAEAEKAKEDWLKLDKEVQKEYEVRRKDLLKNFENDCKEFMASDKWKDYAGECKRLKIPVRSLLFHKKKVIKKLAKGMKMPPSAIPLPSRPDSFPTRPKNAMQLYMQEMKGKVDTLEEILSQWKALDEEARKPYDERADKAMQRYEEEMQDFRQSDEGKAFFRAMNLAQRRRRILGAKNKYLDDLPKKPQGAIPAFHVERLPEIKKANPGKKGFELKKLVQEAWQALSDDERQKYEEAAKERSKEYEARLSEFKASDNWKHFQKAVKFKKPIMKFKGGKPNPAAILIPSKPESFPQQPKGAIGIFVQEQKDHGATAEQAAAKWKALEDEEREKYTQAAHEAAKKYEEDMKAFKASKEGKQYYIRLAGAQRRRKQVMAQNKFLGDMPKKPQGAFDTFQAERLPVLRKEHADKTGTEVKKLLVAEWNDENPAKKTYEEAAQEKMKKYEEEMAEFKQSDKWKAYSKAIAIRKPMKTLAKAKGPAKPQGPKAPDSLPKKPLGAFQDFCKSQSGKSLGQMAAAWKEIEPEKKAEFERIAKENEAKYQEELKAFMKTAEGKKYFREKDAFGRRQRQQKAKERFLGGEDAPQEPKRPPSAYFIFVSESRGKTESTKMGDQAKELTKMWNELDPEKKKEVEERAKEMKAKYDKEMEEYRNSAGYKKYQKALTTISGKKAQQKRAVAKAKVTKAAGRGRGGGARGRGASAPAAPAAGGENKADNDSDSDVMGSDSDDSSSSSDSD
eukprot:TRINITY_DN62864_c2_g1_i1.p1 TRINITY_DN62864_c2_g1~~TRINITY_DN62864_c2_g1_i1.p1  ORF type:complete len:1324 (-),score=421.87 TRINITY_DN62864_c2_g1_i1:282-3959(-)